MKQRSLFDDDVSEAPSLSAALVVTGPAAQKLNKKQKRFNQLIALIEAARHELAQWQAFAPRYDRRVISDFIPLQAKLREKRVAIVNLLDKAMTGNELNKKQKAKVADILTGQLAELLEAQRDPQLEALYDKYSDLSFDEVQQESMEIANALAGDLFGIDLDDDEKAATPEALAQRIAEKLHANLDAPPLREKAAAGASLSVREVYRQLVSTLHPDREPDEAERARKTTLMQQVNRAYQAGDLLALLELQLSIEQIDPKSLANLTQERLGHYNLVLEEQLQRLHDECAAVKAPFDVFLSDMPPKGCTPDAVLRALDKDLKFLKITLRGLDADLVRFRDINQLKASLRDYQIGQNDVDELDMLEALFVNEVKPRRRR